MEYISKITTQWRRDNIDMEWWTINQYLHSLTVSQLKYLPIYYVCIQYVNLRQLSTRRHTLNVMSLFLLDTLKVLFDILSN